MTAVDSLVPPICEENDDLVSYLSTKLNDYYIEWIQSNYLDLFSNYQAIYSAYHQLKQENQQQRDQINTLKLRIMATTSEYKKQILGCKHMVKEQLNEFIKFKQTVSCNLCLDHSPNPLPEDPKLRANTERENEEIHKLKHEMEVLQNEITEINATNQALSDNVSMSSKLINELQDGTVSYQQTVRRLEDKNKELWLRFNAMQIECDRNIREKEHESNKQQLLHQQTERRYMESVEMYKQNMKCVDCFLSQLTEKCQQFVNKYSSSSQNVEREEELEREREEEEQEEIELMTDIQPKLSMTFSNVEEVMNYVSIFVLNKEMNRYLN
mmetsp:Transcript_66559/g.105778  ORF Transcript_66559/g.105778 Transcript_66559/m.105778 type:complete len:326 (+) Transcript_66559:27-1004(+)